MPPSPHGRTAEFVAREVAPAMAQFSSFDASSPIRTYTGPPLSPLQLSGPRPTKPATSSNDRSQPSLVGSVGREQLIEATGTSTSRLVPKPVVLAKSELPKPTARTNVATLICA